MHIIQHLQELTLCHHIFFTPVLGCVQSHIFHCTFCCFGSFANALLLVFSCSLARCMDMCVCFFILFCSYAVFCAPFALQVYLKVRIYLIRRLSAVSVAFTSLFEFDTNQEIYALMLYICVCLLFSLSLSVALRSMPRLHALFTPSLSLSLTLNLCSLSHSAMHHHVALCGSWIENLEIRKCFH